MTLLLSCGSDNCTSGLAACSDTAHAHRQFTRSQSISTRNAAPIAAVKKNRSETIAKEPRL